MCASLLWSHNVISPILMLTAPEIIESMQWLFVHTECGCSGPKLIVAPSQTRRQVSSIERPQWSGQWNTTGCPIERCFSRASEHSSAETDTGIRPLSLLEAEIKDLVLRSSGQMWLNSYSLLAEKWTVQMVSNLILMGVTKTVFNSEALTYHFYLFSGSYVK